ncbi:2-oxoacid:ferredoxin oxidoreductase subunit gamma [Candidatus Woesearchaeota archaeon]|nr:2-oxoacid:ferredoxin oxidoreductase subunit gamma [Candidatus Woesearchaeota archaeon]
MKDSIICAGFGGQGVVLTGSLIANAALKQGLETCGMVSYGVEMRGGTANSSAIISDKKIGSPVVVNPTTAIIMNDPSLERFEPKLQENGLLILNTTECKTRPKRKDIKLIEIKATALAQQLGNKKVANVILVGAYIKERKIINLDSAFDVMPKVLKGKERLVEINKKALEKGYSMVE